MCGIFGSVFESPDVTVDVDGALASIRYRGPDDSRVFRGRGVVLGHNRLSILDLTEGGAQPKTSGDGSVVVVFNGEIYNHHELRRELESLGHSFRTRSDTEVIVEGYRAWGDRVVARLDGMFAIGIFDDERRRLLLARDRSGKKPLFYTRRARGIRFASEVKALLASGIERELDLDSLPTMLALGYTVPPRSMIRGVEQLAPASLLTLDEGGDSETRRYWRAPFAAAPLELSTEEAEAEVFRHVDRAVRSRLEADVPLGAFLSGGIDSSIVVGLMARHMRGKVKTFSIGFAQDPKFDETSWARIAARAFDTDHTEFVLEPTSFDLVERLVEHHDGPFGDSSAIPTSVVSMLTRRHVTVALTGDGGDELFCGYTRFLAVEASERMPEPVRRVGGLVSRGLPDTHSDRTAVSRVKRLLARSAEPLTERLLSYCQYFAFELQQILSPELRERPSVSEAMDFNRAVLTNFEGASPLARVLAHNFETYLPYDLLVKADRVSMMHSLETRSPFLDTRLIELAARLPAKYLRQGAETKWILKRAFKSLLPPEIYARRDKVGFGVPLGTWFRGDLKSYLLDHFGDGAQMWQYVNRPFVQSLLDDHFQERRDEGMRLWLLLTLEIWLRSTRRPSLKG